jgi:hypothetical protein
MKATLCLLVVSSMLAAPAFAGTFSKNNVLSTTTSAAPKWSSAAPSRTFGQPKQTLSNCFPVHRIAHGYDYCTNTPILH